MPSLQRRIVLWSCLTILFAVCGCKQAPWENLTPQYTVGDLPHLYSISTVSKSQNNLHSIVVSNDGEMLWAVGDLGSIVKSQDRGDHWAAVASGTTKALYSIAVSADGKTLWTGGDTGTILKSEDRGDHWAPVADSGTTNSIQSIAVSRHGETLWAACVGEVGARQTSTILRSEDWGNHWVATSNEKNNFNSIAVSSDGQRLWAVGSTILRSQDRGDHWTAVSSGTTNYLSGIAVSSDGERMWAVGESGTILKSEDGGDHWRAIASVTMDHLISIAVSSDGQTLWSVTRASIFSNYGEVFESNDRGDNWNAIKSATISGISFIVPSEDGKTVWAVGGLNTGWTRGGGMIFKIEPSGPAPYLSSAHLIGATNTLEVRVWEPKPPVTSLSLQVSAQTEFDKQYNPDHHLSLACSSIKDEPDRWSCKIPAPLDLRSHPQVTFAIDLGYPGRTDQYTFRTIDDPLAVVRENKYKILAAAILFVLIGVPTILLFTKPLWNLSIYRFLRLNRFEKIDIPVVGSVLQLVPWLVMVLPWFIRRPRTLDAWIAEHRAALDLAWHARWEPVASAPQEPEHQRPGAGYVPLPIVVAAPGSAGTTVDKPGAEDIRKLVRQPRWTVQIVGPGGAGKTTLARAIGDWALENSKGAGLSDHPMVPIWIDEELEADTNNMPFVAKGILAAALADEEIEDELFTALLRKQRLLVFVDRLSERPGATQQYVEKIYRTARVGALVITTRSAFTIEGSPGMRILPLALDSGMLLYFMTSLLKAYLGEIGEEEAAGKRPFGAIQEQLELGKRLAGLIRVRRRNEMGGIVDEDVPLVPLLVRLFVQQAVELIRKGKGLDDMPLSLPEIFAENLRQVNPDDSKVPHYLEVNKMLKLAKALARLSLGEDYIPKEFTRDMAIAACAAAGAAAIESCDPLKRLSLNGVLIERTQGAALLYRYALDPVAEYIGAEAIADDCGSDHAKWEEIFEKSSNAPGFQTALRLTRQAYGPSRGWNMEDTV